MSKIDQKKIEISELEKLKLGPSWSNNINTSFQEKNKFSKDKKLYNKNYNKNSKPLIKNFDTKNEINIKIDFYPKDNAFDVLIKEIKKTKKAYKLFDIANLILEKPDRFLISINMSESDLNNILYCSIDGVPFLTEKELFYYILKNYKDKYITEEYIDVDPPKGTFSIINQCSITGKLISPPNFHLYSQLLEEHYYMNVDSILPYDPFLRKIKSIKDQKLVDQWIKNMSQKRIYLIKGSNEKLLSIDDLKNYLFNMEKEKIFFKKKKTRFDGILLNTMPENKIKKYIINELNEQKKFPFQTANNLRGRLRRMKLNIFKMSTSTNEKNISYICGIKPKRKDKNQLFSDPINKIIKFISNNNNLNLISLKELYLKNELNQNDKNTFLINLKWLINEGYIIEKNDGKLYSFL